MIFRFMKLEPASNENICLKLAFALGILGALRCGEFDHFDVGKLQSF